MAVLGLLTTLVLPILIGGYLAQPFHSFRTRMGWTASGVVVGIPFFTGITFLYSFRGSMPWFYLIASLVILAAIGQSIRKKYSFSPLEKEELPQDPIEKWVSIGLLAISAIIIFWCMCQVMHQDERGISIGFKNNYGDLGLHFHFITSFLYGGNLPPENPIFSGIPLRYPYLTDFYSAILLKATGNLEWAVELPGIIFGWAFIVLFYQWTKKLTGSFLSGALAPFLFLCTGGLGFLLWFDVFLPTGMDGAPDVLTKVPQAGYEWGNLMYTLFVTQRSLQWAFPLVIFLLATTKDAAESENKWQFLFVGILAGMMPIIHGHSVIALCIFGLFFIIRFPSKKWLYMILPLTVLWLPQILFLSGIIGKPAPSGKSFLSFNIGWHSDGLSIPLFWLKNTGPFIPIIFYAIWAYWKDKLEIVWLALASFTIFLLGNLVTFAPWEWDNIKVLIFWYLGSLPLVCFILSKMLLDQKKWFLPIGIIFIFCLSFTGLWDMHLALKKGGENTVISPPADIEAGEWIRKNTPKNAVFLAAHTFNQPLIYSGRKMFMGYDGHIWSHGLPNGNRAYAIEWMGAGKEGALAMMRDHGITHVLYGRRERDQKFNREFLQNNLKVLTMIRDQYLVLEFP